MDKKIIENGIPYYIIGAMTEDIHDHGIPDGAYFMVEFDGQKISVKEEHIRL